jgi:hypothetical protein
MRQANVALIVDHFASSYRKTSPAAIAGDHAERLQFAMQRRALHADKISGS